MKKSEKLARKTVIGMLIAACLEVGLIGLGLVLAYSGRYDRACFWLLCCVVLDMQFAGWKSGMEDSIAAAEEAEMKDDLVDFLGPRQSFSERLEELNRKNNKQ